MDTKFPTIKENAFYTEERCSIIEILNTKEYKSVSLAETTVIPGVTTSNHTLKDSDEIYYILSGKGIATIDGKTFNVKSGDALFIPKNTSQFIENTGDQDLKFLCVCSPRFNQECYISNE